MALQINTNIGALMASAAASSVNRAMETSMERLSTGKRINTAADDAAGSAISSRLTSQIRGTNQAIRNASDAQSFIDTAEGAHVEVVNILQRMRELAVQAANDTNDTNDRNALSAEMSQLTTEINRIANVTQWAGQKLLNGTGGTGADGEFKFQIGANTAVDDTLSVTINSLTAGSIGVGGSTGYATDTANFFNSASATAEFTHVGIARNGADWTYTAGSATVTIGLASNEIQVTGLATGTTSLALNANVLAISNAINNAQLGYNAVHSTDGSGTFTLYKGGMQIGNQSQAQSTISSIDEAIVTVNEQRAQLGAYSNRLDSTIANMTNVTTNMQASLSRINDADFAEESTNLAKSQILQQASTAMLAQANASKQGVLSLLQR